MLQKLTLLLIALQIALPACAAKRVTVEQLRQALVSARGKPDTKLSQMLSGMELTERLNSTTLSELERDLPGVESQRSLVALADLSAFLDPPALEIPAASIPDLAAQREIMARAVDYTTKTIRQLPNFFATRDTIHFEDSPQGQRADSSIIPYVPLHAVGRFTATVLFRDGHEVVEPRTAKEIAQGSAGSGLTTIGVFGPILGIVLVDANQGKLVWSHWEKGTAGPRAVFRFAIPRETSHYKVQFCCLSGYGGNGFFEQISAYHGEIAVDPFDGSILRLSLQADLKPTDPLAKSDLLVEYGPVEIGGKTYNCPVKSISVTLAPEPTVGMQRYRGQLLDQETWAAREHLQTLLNDVAFTDYHVFRAETRMLAGNNSSIPDRSVTSATEQPAPMAPPAAEAKQPAPAAAESESTSLPAPANVATESTSAASAAPSPAPPSPAVAEISEGKAVGLADIPVIPPPAQGKGFSLRVTTRLVDVGVVALDKKGHPVTDLQREDFEIYDNGRKQNLRYFSRPGAQEAVPAPNQPVSSPDEPVYSNRRADIGDAKAGTGSVESSTTILLIDAPDLAWADFTYSRDQMLRFLPTLPAMARVGIYIQNIRGFQVLVEATDDRVKLASALHAWKPDAQHLARAQEEERRNRQQFEDVSHVEDLQYVNGNSASGPDTIAMVDPQLRDFGSNRSGSALATLVLVARHLAATPGRKDLVWVASENVLANWTDQAVSSDKGSKHIEEPVLRAQEALNDAQVSVYPLDASQLETHATDASIGNRNIQLAPSVTAPPQAQSGGAAPGRVTAEMQQDLHPVQGPIRAMAEATGGRVLRRGGDLTANLHSVLEDGRAAYLLGFSPDSAADDQYHLLTVKVASRRGVVLRYRTGYLYGKEPATLKDRFRQAVWEPLDVSEIAVRARPLPAFSGSAFKLNVAANDLGFQLTDGRWNDKVDIFVVERSMDGSQARVSERQLVLSLQPATYQKVLETGIPFDQFVQKNDEAASIRMIVVDEGSGRMGSVTLPSAVQNRKP